MIAWVLVPIVVVVGIATWLITRRGETHTVAYDEQQAAEHSRPLAHVTVIRAHPGQEDTDVNRSP